MLQRHRPFSSSAPQHQLCSNGKSQLKLGCSRPTGRRFLLLAEALDGRAKQAFVGSESSTAAATTQQQQQQLSSAFQPSNADSSSSSIGQQAAPVSPAGASGTAVNSSHPQSPPLSPAVPSWESWCAHFEQQDVYGTRLDSLAAPLAAAVAAEDYTTAAAIKAEMNELVAADAVAEVQSRLSLALAEERYGDAAGLRDQGWALLAGWWACMSPLNPRGHLLHIYPEYGRWTGKAYSPRDLGELQGWGEDELGQLLGRGTAAAAAAARRQGPGFSRRQGSNRSPAAALDPEGLAQLGTPLLEVFVRREQGESSHQQQQQSQSQQWSSQAVLLLPAGGTAADAAVGAARDIGLEAEIGELFRSAVSKAVWGRSGLGGDTAAAAASDVAYGTSSSSRRSSGMDNMFSLIRHLGGEEPPSPFNAGSGSSYELLFGEDRDVAGASGAAELEPWEELLNAAEPLLRTAAAAADLSGGVPCADGVTRPLQRQQQQQQQQPGGAALGPAAEAPPTTPVLQLLLEVVEGSKSVLLAARVVTPAGCTASGSAVTHGTAWVVADLPGGPAMVLDWSKVPPGEVGERQARIAASLEAQRVVRDMLGAQENWWMTEFMGSWSPPAAAAAAEPQQHQQQQQQTDMDWQSPLQLLQQQQDLEERQQQQQSMQRSKQDQQGDMTLLETTEDEEDSWPALDAVSRTGFYADFYQDYGPGVQSPAVAPGAADAGFEQQAAAARDTAGSSSSSSSSMRGMGPAEVDEVLETLAELKDVYGATSSSSSSQGGSEGQSYIAWLPPAAPSSIQEQQRQQQQSRGSRRHNGPHPLPSRSSSSWPSASSAAWASPAAAIGAAVADGGIGVEGLDGDELERHPAVITMHSRDKFTIKPQPQAGAGQSSSSSSREEATGPIASKVSSNNSSINSSSGGNHPQRSLFVVEVPTCLVLDEEQQQKQQVEAEQQQAEGSGFFTSKGHEHGPIPGDNSSSSSSSNGASIHSQLHSKGYSRVWQMAAHQILLQYACSSSSSSGGGGDPLPVTWRQPLADIMAARAAEVMWGAGAAAVASALSTLEEDAVSENADRHSCSCSLGVAEDAPLLVVQLPAELVDQTLACIAGSSSSSSSEEAVAAAAAAKAEQAAATGVQVPKSAAVAAVAAAAAAGTAGIAAAIDPEEGLTYRRLNTKQHPTDQLQGLFLGSFGPHGPELLSLSRSICMETGEEQVVALKLTGDPNVPAGQVSFRARVGRRHRRDAKGVYPPQLDVVARYPGEGRVAGLNFANPRWVDGELLVFNSSASSSASSWTSGAGLGFVYSMPGEKRFLILLNRVSLDC